MNKYFKKYLKFNHIAKENDVIVQFTTNKDISANPVNPANVKCHFLDRNSSARINLKLKENDLRIHSNY